MMKHIKKIGVLLFLMLFGWIHPNAIAETANMSPAEEFASLKERYPDESAVITELRREMVVEVSGDSLLIKVAFYQETMILQNPIAFSKDEVYSSSFSKVEGLKAYTMIPGKKKYSREEVVDFKRSYDKDSFVFFDDTEVISFNYPQLTEGCKIVTQYTTEMSDPHLLGRFYFSNYLPVLSSTYEILADKEVVIDQGVFNDPGSVVQFEQSSEGKKVRYSFSAKDLPAIDIKRDGPKFGYLTQSAHGTISSYTTESGKQVNVLSSLDDLHNWYRTFIDGLDIEQSVEMLATAIVDKDDSDLEKVRKIFYWVQDNVRYIAFEQGMRGFIPHAADYVMEKRYGDCKDMTSVLVGLLRSQGLDAHYTWIGTRDLPYKYTELPTPSVDNHMIASVELDGETIFLDATGSYSPVGYPTSMIQGKESLVSLGEDYKVVTVPVVPKEQNLMIDSAFVALDKGTVSGTGQVVLTGLVKVANTYKLTGITQKSTEKYLRRLLSKGSNKFVLDDASVSNVEDLDQPIEIDYEFNVADYYREIGDEVYVNLCLDKSLLNAVIKDREVPIENDYNYINRSVVTMDLPEGYEVSFLPEDIKAEESFFGFTINYEQKGNKVIATKEFYVNYLLLPVDSFTSWNKIIRQYSQSVRNSVVLKKKNS